MQNRSELRERMVVEIAPRGRRRRRWFEIDRVGISWESSGYEWVELFGIGRRGNGEFSRRSTYKVIARIEDLRDATSELGYV